MLMSVTRKIMKKKTFQKNKNVYWIQKNGNIQKQKI